jgi:hypothetical protein
MRGTISFRKLTTLNRSRKKCHVNHNTNSQGKQRSTQEILRVLNPRSHPREGLAVATMGSPHFGSFARHVEELRLRGFLDSQMVFVENDSKTAREILNYANANNFEGRVIEGDLLEVIKRLQEGGDEYHYPFSPLPEIVSDVDADLVAVFGDYEVALATQVLTSGIESISFTNSVRRGKFGREAFDKLARLVGAPLRQPRSKWGRKMVNSVIQPITKECHLEKKPGYIPHDVVPAVLAHVFKGSDYKISRFFPYRGVGHTMASICATLPLKWAGKSITEEETENQIGRQKRESASIKMQIAEILKPLRKRLKRSEALLAKLEMPKRDWRKIRKIVEEPQPGSSRLMLPRV